MSHSVNIGARSVHQSLDRFSTSICRYCRAQHGSSDPSATDKAQKSSQWTKPWPCSQAAADHMISSLQRNNAAKAENECQAYHTPPCCMYSGKETSHIQLCMHTREGMVRTHEHLDEEGAVSVPGVLVPAVGQVICHIQNDPWIHVFPAQHWRKQNKRHCVKSTVVTTMTSGLAGGSICARTDSLVAGACSTDKTYPTVCMFT